MILKRIFLVLLILTLPSKLLGDTDIDDNNHPVSYTHLTLPTMDSG